MRGRTKAAQSMVEKMRSDLAAMVLRRYYERAKKSPAHLEELKRELRRAGESPEIDALAADDLNPENYKIGFENPAGFAAASVAASAGTAEIIEAMGWTFAVSKDAGFFITSDNPCVVCNPTASSPLYRGGLIYEDSFVLLPLRRDVALVAGWKTPAGERWGDATADYVRALNLWTASYASELLIAPKPTFPGVDELPWDRKEPPHEVSG
jgi:hypothetical protein